MNTIHVVTVLQMHLATVDAGGNLVRREPLAVNVTQFTAAEFAAAFDALAQARAKVDAEIAAAEKKPDA